MRVVIAAPTTAVAAFVIAAAWCCDTRSACHGHPETRLTSIVSHAELCLVFPQELYFISFVLLQGYDLLMWQWYNLLKCKTADLPMTKCDTVQVF